MSEQIYRQCLKEKLLDLAGELKTGRSPFTHDSNLYKKLDSSLNDVIKVLEDHEGEEKLPPAVRQDLENKLQIMKNNAIPYRDSKLQQGALAAPSLRSAQAAEQIRITRTRFQAADHLVNIDTKIPEDPGAEQGIIAPNVLEPGDHPETNWRLKYKQNVSYLAKKQLRTYENRSEKYQPTGRLEQEEFDLLMDFAGKENILAYKDDAHLCQKYPSLRMKLEKAVNASEMLSEMSDEQVTEYIQNWKTNAMTKALEAAEKAKKRKGQQFTEADKRNFRARHEVVLREKIKKFGSAAKLKAAGDVLEQIGRFTDLKMKVISDRNYVRFPHTNTLGRVYSVSDYEDLIRNSTNQKERQFYTNLRDIRELEDAGIRHIKPAEQIDKAFYKKVDETVHTTIKRDFLSFKMKNPSFGGLALDNTDMSAKSSEDTSNKLSVGQSSKFRVGKLGLKLHSANKDYQLSGSVAFGQIKTSSSVGVSVNKLGADVSLSAEMTALRARIKGQGKILGVKGSLGAETGLGVVSARIKAGIGSVKVKDVDGSEHTELGVSAKAGAIAAAAKGGIGGTLNLFGLKIGVNFAGYAGAVGADTSFNATVGGVGFSLGGALGVGVGLKVSINWSEAVTNLKNLWRKSKLMNLITKYKENRKGSQKSLFAKAKNNIKEGAEAQKKEGKKADQNVKDDFDVGSGKKADTEIKRRNSVSVSPAKLLG